MAMLEEEKKEYSQPRTMRQAMQQAVTARGAGIQSAATEPAATQQPPVNATSATPVQTDPTAPAGYNLGKKVGGMFGGLKEGMDARVNRQIDLVTAAPRAAMQFGGNVVRGMRGDAPNTEAFTMSPSSAQAATPQPSANVAAFRQTENENRAPRLGAMISARDDRQADAMLYGDQAKIVGGNSPQAQTVMARGAGFNGNTAIGVNLSPQDQQLKANMGKIDQLLASGVQPTQQQAEAIGQLRRDAGFLRGGTDRVPVGPDGRPIGRGAGLTTGGRYSFQGTQDAAEKFAGAVSPQEYSPEAQAARNTQNQQFLARQGYEQVNPDTGMTASQEQSLSGKNRVALTGARLAAKTAADKTAVDRMQADGTLELGRGNLAVNQAQQATQAKGAGLDMTAKQMEIDSKKTTESLLAKYDAPDTNPEEKVRIEKSLITRGVLKPPTKQLEVVKRALPAKYGETAGEQVGVANLVDGRIQWDGGGQPRIEAPKSAIDALAKDPKLAPQFQAKYGYLPPGV